MPQMPAMPDMPNMPGMTMSPSRTSGPIDPGAAITAGAMWLLMIVAMMLPSALPAVAYAGTHSLRTRRTRAMAQFAAGYVATWLAAGLAILGVGSTLGTSPGTPAGLLAVAAAWQLTPLKRRAMQDCHRSRPLPPGGWPAARAAVGFGLHNGWACVRSCWAIMLVMTAGMSAPLLWMGAIAVVTLSEKCSQRPRSAARRVAITWGLAAAGALVAGL